MNKDILNDIDKKVIEGLRLRVFNDPLGQKLLRFYEKGILDEWTIEQIYKRVDKELHKEAFNTLPFKTAPLHSGEFIFGTDSNTQSPIKSHIQYMNAGSLLIANTGSGKTTLLCFYAVQIASGVKGMWLVDLRKKEFRLLMPIFLNRGIELVVIRSRKFKINPLQVPYKTDPYEYASTIADVLVKVLNLPPRASVLLSSTIIKLYKEYNVFNGGCKYPTLFHLFEAVRTNKDANSQAKQAILDNLETLLLAFGTQMLGYYRGWPVHELAKHHIAFELTGQPESGKDLVLNYLVAAEFISQVSRGISNKGMDLWLSIDEAQRLFSQQKETASSNGNSLTDLAGLVRGTGTGMFISALTPDDLSNKIPSITSTRIMGRCGSVPEYQSAGKFLGLTPEQITWCIHHMIPGTFVGQLSEGQWRYPFLFNIPKMNALKPVTDDQADESLQTLNNLDVEPVEFSNWSAVECINVPTANNHDTTQLNETEYKLLKTIVDSPMLPSSDYVKLAKISPNTLAKLRPILLEKGFVREHLMDSANRGRGKRIWEPLESAKQAINGFNKAKGIEYAGQGIS